jgi:hypothetical protein
MADGDASGERMAASVLEHVAPYRAVRWIKLDKDKQPPADYSAAELTEKLG